MTWEEEGIFVEDAGRSTSIWSRFSQAHATQKIHGSCSTM